MSISGRLASTLATAANHAVASLLPQDCFLCGHPESDMALCRGCHDSLPALPAPACPVCAAPLAGGDICGVCLADPPHFDATVAAFRYAFPLDQLIQALKYGHRLALADVFAEEMLAGPTPDAAVLVPLPLSLPRLRQRGFNQAVEIGRALARRLNRPLLSDAGRRPLDAPAQASLPWQERRKNVRGVFAATRDFHGLSVAVIDDVMTTGATLDEFARVLKQRGAVRVTNWVVARTLKD